MNKLYKMETSNLPPNTSNEQLMGNKEPVSSRAITKSEWLTVAILCYVNLINYMDRYTVAGIMTDIKDQFHITDDKAGLLQTVFVISYMLFAPLFGYLGDRYSRKMLMSFGVFLWGLTTLVGSFMNSYSSFISLRALVGIGEASYSTIAPTIISDLFVKDLRAKMLALFYFAIPVGSGLGYIVGSETARLAGSWHWALRVTPIMAGIAVLLIAFLVKDPERGESEGKSHLTPTSWGEDLLKLVRNRSFMHSTAGFMCVSFVTGALAWWGPDFIYRGVKLQPGKEDTKLNEISFSFGWIAMLAGILGVPFGSFLSTKFRFKMQRADPLICGIGVLISVPLFVVALLIARYNLLLCYFLIFFGQLAININWSISADILLYVVIPTRRSTAEAFQILISHAFGDAGSPYFIGALADFAASRLHNEGFSLNKVIHNDNEVSYYSLQYALFTTSFVEVLGGIFFLVTAVYIVKDKLNAEREVRVLERILYVTGRGRELSFNMCCLISWRRTGVIRAVVHLATSQSTMGDRTDIINTSNAVDVTNPDSWIPDMPSGPLDKYRVKSRFNWKLLRVAIEEPELLRLKLKIWNTLAKEKEFEHPVTTLSSEEQKRRVSRMLMRFHALKYDIITPEILNSGYIRKTKHLMAMNEALAVFDRNLSVKFALGVSLFGNTIPRLGTDRHVIYCEKAWRGEILGCFAITEFSHGSNTKNFRTTATYDPKNREFIIHTPDFEAAKCWVGNLGRTCTYAIVFAQLITAGENHGLHCFIVPIRDPNTLMPYPGLTVGDMGEKNGLNGIDNGFIMFNQYRIPKENLLNKTGDVNADGSYETTFTNPQQILGAALEVLTTGRIGISQEASVTLCCAVTIAIRYAAVRRQFGPKKEEIPILEYPLHQWRLLPYLAAAVAFRIFIADFVNQYLEVFEDSLSLSSKNLNLGALVGEIHALVSACKPLLTWVCRDALQECREACGGHGYLKAGNLGDLRADHDPSVTYEGDNNVLLQQTSNWLLRQATSDRNESKNSILGTVQFLDRFDHILRYKFVANKKSDVICHGFIVSAFEWLLCWLIKETDFHLSSLQSQGIDTFSARAQTQVYKARTLSLVYAEYNVLNYFWRRTHKPELDPNVKVVLQKLFLLYGLWCVDKHLIYFYQGGFAQGTSLVNLVRDGVVSLCSDILPDCVSVVDAIAPPDFALNSVLGRADGKLYANLKDRIFNQPGTMDRAYWWQDAVSTSKSKL